jgi:hypothetical protein
LFSLGGSIVLGRFLLINASDPRVIHGRILFIRISGESDKGKLSHPIIGREMDSEGRGPALKERAMAKPKKRAPARKKSAKRGKASVKPARKKTAKRAMAKKAKAKSRPRRTIKRVTEPIVEEKPGSAETTPISPQATPLLSP